MGIAALLGACLDPAGPIPTQNNSATSGMGTPPPPQDSPPVQTVDPLTPGGGGPVSFDDDVHPILVAKCGECHSVETSTPGHGAADADEAFEAVQGMSRGQPVYLRILARASGDDPAGFMPPPYAGCEGPLGAPDCLSDAEFDLIELWVEQGASNR